MAMATFEVDKFTRDNDFSLWRINMKALLVHQGLSSAIDGDAMIKLKELDKDKVLEVKSKAHNAILLSLGNRSIEGGL